MVVFKLVTLACSQPHTDRRRNVSYTGHRTEAARKFLLEKLRKLRCIAGLKFLEILNQEQICLPLATEHSAKNHPVRYQNCVGLCWSLYRPQNVIATPSDLGSLR